MVATTTARTAADIAIEDRALVRRKHPPSLERSTIRIAQLLELLGRHQFGAASRAMESTLIATAMAWGVSSLAIARCSNQRSASRHPDHGACEVTLIHEADAPLL